MPKVELHWGENKVSWKEWGTVVEGKFGAP